MHLDMDAFFAAVEERDKPWLAGRPIVVGADPKEGQGRGVVATANYKARGYGIRSAMPISQAWRLSEEAAKRGEPRVEFLLGQHRRYSEVSREIMEYLRTQADVVEVASIDEAYLEVKVESDKVNGGYEYAVVKAREIKAHILKTQQLTCSIGIGPNKLVAKIAAGMKKPDGLTVVRPDDVQNFLDPLPANVIPGIGPKSKEVLDQHGIHTIRELRSVPEARLIEFFGKWGAGMHERSKGIDESAVVAEYETKSIGEQETFERDTLEAGFLMERLRAMAASVAAGVARGRFSFRTVEITVRFADFETTTRAHTISKPAHDKKTIEIEATQLFLPFLDRRENPRRKLIRLLGVRVSKLSTSGRTAVRVIL
jgi:DNA polymerase IV (DinB-like DNA polymerase)